MVHARIRYSPDMSDWMAAWKLWGRSPGVVGTEGAEALPFAKEAPGEAVFYKQTYDGFSIPACGSTSTVEKNGSFSPLACLPVLVYC